MADDGDIDEGYLFQSTRPVRGATATASQTISASWSFNPRAPCGARLRANSKNRCLGCRFNPRAPCGARLSAKGISRRRLAFQSTRPVRGATDASQIDRLTVSVSIHAPRAGRDLLAENLSRDALGVSIHAPRAGRDESRIDEATGGSGFNPRAPCGARRKLAIRPGSCWMFQSTRPVRGATQRCCKTCIDRSCFNPRAPCGARRSCLAAPYFMPMFQSTRPVRGATRAYSASIAPNTCFNPRAPCGARHRAFSVLPGNHEVSIHAPRAGRDLTC